MGGHEVRHTVENLDYRWIMLAMFLNSINPIASHKTRQCSWIEVIFICSLTSCLVCTPLAACAEYLLYGDGHPALFIEGSKTLSSDDPVDELRMWGMSLLGAVFTFLNLGLEIWGYQVAKPGKAAMFVYLEVPFGYLLQCIRGQHAVRTSAVIGSCLIIGASVLSACEQLAPVTLTELLPIEVDEELTEKSHWQQEEGKDLASPQRKVAQVAAQSSPSLGFFAGHRSIN